ncbi:DUF4440 domain-containing protein [Mesobacillus harenae]|uniref:nuclear transport factor 2 family protein n=1 Tax=Mesobacillus harenae TaxID=2213203 RepID=UPI001F557D84|nr:DUF4440 domain-containing protein [Mesobacillus harenae]
MEHSALEAHIFNLEMRLMRYVYEEMEELLTEDFLEFGSSGRSFDKQMELNAVKAMKSANHSIQYTVTDFKIKVLSADIVLATYQTLRHIDGNRSLRSSIWKLNHGSWQMTFHQGTPKT